MDLTQIQKQLELAKETINQMSNQNRIFDQTLQEAIKGASDKDKPELERVRVLSLRAIALAKQGKNAQAQELIKQFKRDYGSKSNQ